MVPTYDAQGERVAAKDELGSRKDPRKQGKPF
jgi:hypothetical protein